MRTLTSVKPLNDFRLECIFSDGTKGIADIKPYLNKGVFKVDLSADTLWHISAKA